MPPVLDQSGLETQQTRTDLTLARIVEAWKLQPRGNAFGLALVGWLRSTQTKHTLRVYAHCVTELFEWFERDRGSIPTPDLVLREDAASYERWLRERTTNLTRYRLEMDPDRRLDVAIYDFVASNPGVNIDGIREKLSTVPEFVTMVLVDGQYVRMLAVDAKCRGGLAGRLAELTKRRTIDRTPTIEQARRGAAAELDGPTWDPPANIFKYRVPEIATPAGDQRSMGNSTRLAVLAAFWGWMSKSGENAPGSSEPLLRVNVWLPLLKTNRQKAASHRKIRRLAKTPNADTYERLLAVTFLSSHGNSALDAARMAKRGEQVPRGSSRVRFDHLRDRALLLIMLQAGGPRADEIGKMRRQDLVDGILTIHGKRGKDRQVPVPPAALDALRQLDTKLASMVIHQGKYGRKMRAEELLAPSSPLLPALRYWGHNAMFADRDAGMTRQGISQRLRRIAEIAGIDPESADMQRIHPHGIRRLYAKEELRAGTPLNVIQANMGHASPSMTLMYAEESEAESLRGKAFEAAPAVSPEPVVPQAAQDDQLPEDTKAPARQPKPIPLQPAVVKVIREERIAPVRRQKAALESTTADSSVDRWQRVLKRTLTTEELASISQCPGDNGSGSRMSCEVYVLDWGDTLGRTKLTEPREQVAELELEAARRSRIQGTEPVPVLGSLRATNKLGHVYCGAESGLVWWGGTSGHLELAMPVPSPRQIGVCGEDMDEADETGLCAELSKLWFKWMNEPAEVDYGPEGTRTRGPTAAGALALWAGEMLDVAAQVEESVNARGGKWVDPDESWSATSLATAEGKRKARVVFREHSNARIVEWFEKFAWQFRPSKGRVGGGELEASARAQKPIDRRIEVPAWYSLPDPIASLPSRDRAELLDFLSIMSGDVQMRDDTSRFPGNRSRADVGRALFAMREYDEALSQVAAAPKEYSDKNKRSLAMAESRENADEASGIATAVFVDLGVTDFDLVEEVRQRKARRKQAPVGQEKREWLADFYLSMLAKAFGDAVVSDPMVRLAATIGRSRSADDYPLAGYRDLFRIDWDKRTIVQEEWYKQEKAKEWSTSSECVARRMARELWELWRSGKKGLPQRRDELLDLVTSMAAYRVPCPVEQELEVRNLRGEPSRAFPVYSQWKLYRSEESPGELEEYMPWELTPEQRKRLLTRQVEEQFEEESELGEEAQARELRLMKFGRKQGGGYEQNPRARCNPYTRRVLGQMPTPVVLMLCAIFPEAM